MRPDLTEWPLPGPGLKPKPGRQYAYTVTRAPHGDIAFVPQNGAWMYDGRPLVIPIVYDCTIVFDLDQEFDWQFSYGVDPDTKKRRRGMTMLKKTDRCHNLQQLYDRKQLNYGPKGRCIRLTFDVDHLLYEAPHKDNVDKFVLHFLELTELQGEPVQIPLRADFDPDIKNPGDDVRG